TARVLTNASLKRAMTALPSLCLYVLLLIDSGSALAQSMPGLPPSGKSQSSTSQLTDSALMGPRRLMQQGKYDQAISQLPVLTANAPGLKGLYRELGTAYYNTCDYKKAEK